MRGTGVSAQARLWVVVRYYGLFELVVWTHSMRGVLALGLEAINSRAYLIFLLSAIAEFIMFPNISP